MRSNFFIDWLYIDAIPGMMPQSSYSTTPQVFEATYHELYYMAEMWCLDSLEEQALRTIDLLFHLKPDSEIDPHFVVNGFCKTSPRSHLRVYLVHMATRTLLHNAQKSAGHVKDYADRLRTAAAEKGVMEEIFMFQDFLGWYCRSMSLAA